MLLLDATPLLANSFALQGETGAADRCARSSRAAAATSITRIAAAQRRRAAQRTSALGISSPTAASTSPATPSHRRTTPAPRPALVRGPRAAACGPLETGLPPSWPRRWRRHPRSRRSMQRCAREALSGAHRVQLRRCRQVPEPPELRDAPPVPHLQLITLQAYGRSYRPLAHYLDIAVLSLRLRRSARRPQQPRPAADVPGRPSGAHQARCPRRETLPRCARSAPASCTLTRAHLRLPGRVPATPTRCAISAAWPEFVCAAAAAIAGRRLARRSSTTTSASAGRSRRMDGGGPGERQRLVRSVAGRGGRRQAPQRAADSPDRGDPRTTRSARQRRARTRSRAHAVAPTTPSSSCWRTAACMPVPLARVRPMLSVLHELIDTDSAPKVRLPAAGCRTAGRPGA